MPKGEARKAVILHPEFAARLNAAADANPNIPPLNYGRLAWFEKEFEKRGMTVPREMIRKYFSGENKPKKDRSAILAEIVGVDEIYLIFGKSGDAATRRGALRNAQVDGVVNLVAGLIQMQGGSPAFPEEGDARAMREHIDVYAIIRGAQYAIHIALAQEEAGELVFSLPPSLPETTMVLGVVQTGPMCFDILELDAEGIAQEAKRTRSGLEVTTSGAYRTGDHEWSKIETFAKRI